jgi:hypothetical protein
MLISTFELLIKNILPPPPSGSTPAAGVPTGRTIIQGYFLTIANTSDVAASLELKLIAESPNFKLRPDTDPGVGLADTRLIAFFDSDGANQILLLPSANDSKVLIFNLTIGAKDTGLFILQPNVTKPRLITDPSEATEVRGYSQISLRTGGATSVNLLLTPEHRGTFLPADGSSMNPDFDQLVYSLPTARGRSLYELTT